MGHKITNLAPSLTAFTLADEWLRELAGVSFEKVKLKFIGKDKYEFTGPLMFTHKGVTGPAIFALSAMSAFEIVNKGETAKLEMDFFPDMSHEDLNAELKKVIAGSPKKQFHNALGRLIPNSFARQLCIHLAIPSHKRNNELSKKEINRALQLLKQLPLTIIGRSPGEEFVTAGGVDISEVDSKNMQSKITPGLYFAGEILNIDGFTGGYNLQAAWAAGRLVGESITENL